MPTHSIKAAEAWRAKNLDPSCTKENRAGGNEGGRGGGQRSQPASNQSSDALMSRMVDAIANDTTPFDTLMCQILPPDLFEPLSVVAIAKHIGLRINGAMALRLCQGLFIRYMFLVDPADEMPWAVPASLKHSPKSSEFAAEAQRIDDLIAKASPAEASPLPTR
jgi:hypothetical protein